MPKICKLQDAQKCQPRDFRNFQNFRNNNRWRYWKGAENGLSCQYGKLKSSESDSPMKIRWPILSDSKFSSGLAFLSILKFAYFWHFYIGKKISDSWVWNYVPCHVKVLNRYEMILNLTSKVICILEVSDRRSKFKKWVPNDYNFSVILSKF